MISRPCCCSKNYLALQKVRYRDLFDYQIDVDENIDTEAARVPPMLAQPFIENSIEHGFKNKGSKGNLSIRFISHDSILRIEIEDDGIGREKAKQIRQQSNKHHQSMATNITRERLSALNRKSKNKISLNIEDLTDHTGTMVTINIPDHLTTRPPDHLTTRPPYHLTTLPPDHLTTLPPYHLTT